MAFKTQKLLLVLARCLVFAVVFLISVEVFLCITGFVLADGSIATGGLNKDDKNKIRILVLGESTSDEDMARESNTRSWPRQLEGLLLKRGFDVRVYSAAKSGTNTYFILRDLASNLDFYRPDIVISMMGINDSAEMGAFQDTFLNQFRIFRLIKWFVFFQPQVAGEEPLIAPEFAEEVEKTAIAIESKQIDFEKVKQRAEALGLDARGLFQFYEGLVFRLVFRSQFAEKDYVLFRRLIETALETGLYGYDLVLSKIYVDGALKNEVSCLEFMVEMAEKFKYQFSEEQISMSLFCRSGNSDLQVKWNHLMKGQKNSIRFSKDNGKKVTNVHYLKVAEQLAQRKIKFFAMGYPTRPIESVRSFFTLSSANAEMVAGISFISNQENFVAELKKRRFTEIFSDRFAGDFGHATDIGNRLIAENVAAHVAEYLQIPR